MYFKGYSLYYQMFPHVNTKEKEKAVIGQIHVSQQGKVPAMSQEALLVAKVYKKKEVAKS